MLFNRDVNKIWGGDRGMILDEMLEEARNLHQRLAAIPTINIQEELDATSRELRELRQGIATVNRRYDGLFEGSGGMEMTQTEFEAAATEYREKKAAAEEAAAAVEEVAERLKVEMETRGVEKAKAGIFEVRYQLIKGFRFDSKAFKEDEPTLFSKYSIDTETKRFMVA